MVSVDGQHAYGVENIVTGKQKDVYVARMISYIYIYVDSSLAVTKEQKKMLPTPKNQGEFDVEDIRGSCREHGQQGMDCAGEVDRIRLGMNDAGVCTKDVSKGAPVYLASQLITMKLAQTARAALQKKGGINIFTERFWVLSFGTFCCFLDFGCFERKSYFLFRFFIFVS